jgi:hypothetical protein
VFEAGKIVALASLTLDPEFADISENLHFFWCRFKVLTVPNDLLHPEFLQL